MDEKELLKRIALLESVNDYLQTEFDRIDELMKMIGFKEGLTTVKATASEIVERGVSI